MSDTEKNCPLPPSAQDFVEQIVKHVRYKKKVRRDVRAELSAHFEDALVDCPDEQSREEVAKAVIENFGDPKLVAKLIRRGKKRCRPAWKKAIIRFMQAVGVFIVLFILYTLWFIHGKPSPSVNYLARMNEMARPELRDEYNAGPHYVKAAELYAEPAQDVPRSYFGFKILIDTPEKRDELEKWLAANKEALETFNRGARKPYYYVEYGVGEVSEGDEEYYGDVPLLLNIPIPNLACYKKISYLGIWHARGLLEKGKVEQAIEQYNLLLRAGQHLSSRLTLIENLVGMSISMMTYEEMISMVDKYELSNGQLEMLAEVHKSIQPTGVSDKAFETEKLLFVDTVEHVFTQNGLFGGHPVPKYYGNIYGIEMFRDYEEFAPMMVVGAAMLHANRTDTIKKGLAYYEQLIQEKEMTPFERKQRGIDIGDDFFKDVSRYRYSFIHIMLPAFERVIDHTYKLKAAHEATAVVVQLQRYKKQVGSYPQSLDELAEAGYIESVPNDPFSDGALVYELDGGSFTLYSVGENFTDEGGRCAYDSKGRFQMWDRENGDTVFWPVCEKHKSQEQKD